HTSPLSISTTAFESVHWIGGSSLFLAEEKTVLVIFQAPSAYLWDNGHQGELALRANEQILSLARIQSQNQGLSSPVVMAGIVRLPAGQNNVDIAGRRLNAQSLNLSSGLRSL